MALGIKVPITLLLIFSSFQLFAQRLNGVVKDKLTNLPIQNVSIKTPASLSFTSISGKFSLPGPPIGDTIKFSCIGYEPKYLVTYKINNDSLIVYLEQHAILLNNVTINAKNVFHEKRKWCLLFKRCQS